MDFSLYLRPTRFLDSQHPTVTALAKSATSGAKDDREKAVRLFYRVRDDIFYDPYGFNADPAMFMASATIERKRGFCIPKAIVYAAALRALGIPSRLGYADVTNHLATKRLLDMMGTNRFVYHGFTEMWLGDRWVKATPAFNASLCEKFGTDALDFDGVKDAVLQPYNKAGAPYMEYLCDRGSAADFEPDVVIPAWREAYPRFFDHQALNGNFAEEAEREKG